MRLQLYLVLAAMCIQSVYPQYSVTISSITAPTDYKCHKTLVLRCQSNDTDCCSVIGKTRIWRKNGITIMNHGTESMTSGKYTETPDDNQNYFELTINNLDDNDFGQEYGCSYSFFSDLITLKSKHLLCPPCVPCGFILLAWTVLGECFILAITAAICYYKKMEFRKWCKALAITFAVTVVVNVVITLSIGNSLCICFDYFDPIYKDGDYKDWYFIALGLILSCLVPGLGVIITYATTKVLVADIGETVELKCLFKGSSGRQITWHKKDDERGTYSSNKEIKSNLPAELRCRLKVTEKFHLCISDVIETDAGIYECSHYGYSVLPFAVCRKQLIVKSGKNQSVESGSSCWPICRVGQDPNTSSSGPEKVRRSPKKERADKKPTDFPRSSENERADKKKERKLIEVVRPQPTRPLPPMHLKTDNTGRAEYSTETEIFKPPALPSINKASDSPRPLPQKPPGTQLDPLSDSTSERKKKKKRKKKEPKQSDEEN